MLDSIAIILSNPYLLGGLVLCSVLGGISLFTAIRLAGIKGFLVSALKYVLAIISVQAITNCFMIILNPMAFLATYQRLDSVTMVIGAVTFWVLIYEANWILKHQRVRNFISKCSNNKLCSSSITK